MALTTAESLLRLFDASSDMLLLAGGCGTIRHASRGWAAQLGWTAEQMVGQNLAGFLHPDDAAAARPGQGALPCRMLTRGGDWRLLGVSVAAEAPGGDRLVIARDVDEAARAAALCREVEAISGVGSWELDLLRGTARLSPVTRAIHETDDSHGAPGLEGLSFYPPEGRGRLEAALTALMAHGTGYDLELPFVSARGTQRWVRTSGAAERRNGRVVRIYGTMEDISHRRQERARLTDFRDIVELAFDGIWVLDATGRTTYANPRMAEILGCESPGAEGALQGRALAEFLLPEAEAPEDHATARTLLAGSGNDGTRAIRDLCLRRADGARVWVSLTCRQRHDAEGALASTIAVVRDITERRARDDELRRSRARLESTLGALREREALLSALFALSPMGIALNDLETGDFIDTNSALLDLTGYDRAGLLLRGFRDLTAPEFRAEQAQALAQLRAVGRFGPLEVEFLGRDGARIPVRLRGMRVAARTGRDLIWSLIEPIATERAQMAELERLGDVARRTTNLVVIADPQGLIEWVNPAFETRTGWTLDEVRGCSMAQSLLSDAAGAQLDGRIRAALAMCEPFSADLRGQGRDGAGFWLRTDIQPRFDPAGRHIGFIGVATEISALIAAQAALEESERIADEARARLQDAVEALEDGFVCFDAEDRLILCNHRYRETYPLTAPAMVPGARFVDILRKAIETGEIADALGREDAWMAERMAQHQRAQEAVIQHLADGRVVRIHEMPTGDGGRVGLRVDVTELHRARQRAESASKAKSDFLANMSHEIRTPLNAVLGMADLLHESPLSADQRAMLDTIRSSGWSLLELLNDILDLARVEAGRMTLESRVFDMGALARRLKALHGPQAAARGLTLELSGLPEGIDLRQGDETRVRQILHNLLGNAVKFTETGGVTLTLALDDPAELRLRVADTGIGMTPDQVARVFDAFEQAEAETARRFGGSGLGMAIVRKLVEMMGGEIALNSSPGRGTEVTLRLPLPRAKAVQQGDLADAEPGDAGHASRAQSLRGRRILVADDNATNRRIFGAMLDRLGMQARFAGNGVEAVELWAQHDFDLVLMDISMPGLGGVEALRQILALAASQGRPAPRVIAATANVMHDQVARYRDEGFAATLPKPTQFPQLVEVLAQAMAR